MGMFTFSIDRAEVQASWARLTNYAQPGSAEPNCGAGPERLASILDPLRRLPNRDLNLRHEHLSVQPAGDFRLVRTLKKGVNASTRLARASTMEDPRLAMSSSGHSETKPSSSRSMIAVKR